MNNLLIVDDEKEILSWLEELFLFEYAQEIEVYTASSGREAIALLERIQFEVVLTDIKMPGMDGHELFNRIKENWPGCKVVFLTGYRNFEDIYQVVRHNDVRYVLKSEDDEAIIKAVDDSFQEIKRMLEREWTAKIRKSDLEKARSWLRKETFQSCLMNPNGLLDADYHARELGIILDFSCRSLMYLIRIQGGEQKESIERADQLEEMLRGYLPGRILVYCHGMDNGYFLLFFQPDSKEHIVWENIFTVTRGALEYTQVNYEKCFSRSFCAVISSEPWVTGEALDKVEQLKKIMVGYLGGKDIAILHMETIEKQQEKTVPEAAGHHGGRTFHGGRAFHGNVQLLKYYLELKQKSEYYDLLNTLCRQMASGKGRHDLLSMEIYYGIAVTLLQFINENHIQEKLAFKIGLYKLLNSNEHANWVEAGGYLLELSEAIFMVLGYFENTLTDRALDRIITYIDQNIMGDLTLSNLAKVGGFNASYLSRLFKQFHRVTVTDYVLKKRMELAKHLLITTNDKIHEIAEQTGYTSSHSFSRAFRNYAGVAPIEYREIHLHI